MLASERSCREQQRCCGDRQSCLLSHHPEKHQGVAVQHNELNKVCHVRKVEPFLFRCLGSSKVALDSAKLDELPSTRRGCEIIGCIGSFPLVAGIDLDDL